MGLDPKVIAAQFGIDVNQENNRGSNLHQQLDGSVIGNINTFETETNTPEGEFNAPEFYGQNPYETRALNQSIGSKWGNGAVKFLSTAGTSTIGNTVGLINGIGAMVTNAVDNDPSTDVMSGMWDNTTSNALILLENMYKKPFLHIIQKPNKRWVWKVFYQVQVMLQTGGVINSLMGQVLWLELLYLVV